MNRENVFIGAHMYAVLCGKIDDLDINEIFVFGSNLAGIHGAGAAKFARKFGAKNGNPKGIQGRAYAIPTKDKEILNKLPLYEIREYVNEFVVFAKLHDNLNFLVTEIGCGLAGYKVKDIAPLFVTASDVRNIYLPVEFAKYIETIR